MLHEKRMSMQCYFSRIFPKDFSFQAVPGPKAVSLGVITVSGFLSRSISFLNPQKIQHTQHPVAGSSKKYFLLFIYKFPSASFISCLSSYFERSSEQCFHRPLSYCLSVISFFRLWSFMHGCYFIRVIFLVAFLLYLLQFSYLL